MTTVTQYDAVFEKAKKRLYKIGNSLQREDLVAIAKSIDLSYQSVYDYVKREIGSNLRTTLEITAAILKYKHENNKK